MASASSSIVATGSSRVAVSRHASLQPVSALRIKPFSNAKTTKSRAQGIAVGVRDARKSNNTRKSWPVYAAETDPVAEEEAAVADDDVQYDIETEEDDMGEAEAVVELSDDELADRGFMLRQLSKLSDEAGGTVATTAEEDAAAQEQQEGISQIIQTIMDIEKLTSADAAEAEEGAEGEESPMPFSDESFYDEVYKNVLEIEAFGTDIKDYSAKDEVDYALVDAVAAAGPDGLGSYPTDLDEKLTKYDVEVEAFTPEEQQILDLVESQNNSDSDAAPPRGINQILSVLEHKPLTEEEQQLLANAVPGEIDPALKEEFDQVLAISMMAAGVESKTDLTSAGLLFASKMADAAKETSGADLVAQSKAALASAKAAGSVSDAELASLTAAAEALAGEQLSVPEDLMKALAEKLQEVESLGALVDEEDDDEETDAAIQAQAAKLLAGQEADLSDFSAIDAEVNALSAPAAPTSAATQFLDNARALLGADFQKLVEQAIQATNDPAQVAAAKEFFLSEAKAQLTGNQLQEVNDALTDFGYAAEGEEPDVPEIDVPSVKEFANAPEVDAAVGEAIKEATAGFASGAVLDASIFIRDPTNPALVEYNRLKAELKEATGVDLDDYRPKEKVADEPMLSAVAQMLKNAADGKPLAEGLDQLDLPQEAAPAQEPLSPELLAVRKQLDEIWAAGDLSFSQPEERELDQSIFAEVDLTLPEADEDEDLSPDAGIMTLPSDTTPVRPAFEAQAAEYEVGEVETADEAKWLQVSEEEWDEAARDVLLADGVVEEVDPEVALAKAEAALERFGAKEGFDESDAELLKEIVESIAEAQVAVDPSMSKVRKASLLAQVLLQHGSVVERAMASTGQGPTIIVPEDLTKEQAAQFVQAYGNKMEEALTAAQERAQQGIYVRSLADAISNVGVPPSALDADSLEAEFRALAAQTLSSEDVADAETNLPDGLITEDSMVEVPASEFEESLKERFTESELEDMKAKAAAFANPLDVDVPATPASEEAQIDSLLAEMGVDVSVPEVDLDELVGAEAAAEQVQEVEEEADVEEGEADETTQALKELVDEIVDEVRVATGSTVDDAVVYEATADEAVDVDAEDEVEEDWEMDEGEAQAMLEEVLEAFNTSEGDQAADEADGAADNDVADADADDDADDDGEAELQTIFNTSATQLLAQDYDDVWEAMGIPEARPKVPSKPRAQERDAEEAEEAELDDYEEEAEVEDDGEGEEDVADAIAEYYKADELDDEADSRASLSAPKTTLDLFGSSPYLEDDGDRAADDTQGLLERVTVSKTGDIFVERIIQVNRVTKVVKGGKIMSFRCVAIVGNRNGIVGVGVGSAREVVQAVTKACQDAKASLIAVPLTKFDSIPHRVESKFKASIAIINPAADGTGCIAGGAVRSVLELAGVKNCLAKRLGSRNPLNNARATIKALQQLQTWGEVAGKRGVPVEYLFAKDESSAAKALASNE